VHGGPRIASLSAANQFVALPNVTSTWQQLTLDVAYSISKNFGIGLYYLFEKLDVEDWATINTAGPQTLPVSALGAQTVPSPASALNGSGAGSTEKGRSVGLEHLIHFSGTKRSSRLSRVRTTADVAAPEVAGTEFLTRSEVSKLLGVSPNTVTRWAREGRLPCQVTLGGHHRFDRELVEQLRKSLYRPASRID